MLIFKRLGIGVTALSLLAISQPASAQDRYSYCQQRASQLSGYYGPVPNRHLPGGALEGAAKGAATGAIGGLIFGKSKKERRKAVRRGAAIGGLIGAIKRGAAKSKIKREARVYRLEMDACMRAGG